MKLKVIYLTKDGLENFKNEYQTLINERPAAVESLKKARELGDLSENGYYKASRAKLSFIDSRIFYLKNLIKYAQIITTVSNESVRLGSIVSINDGVSIKEYKIVTKYEANPHDGKISDVSPLGRALIGKAKGETVSFKTPSDIKEFTIVNIRL